MLSTEMPANLYVKKLSEHAQLPKRGSKGAAGYDICSAHDCVVPEKGKLIVPTDLSIALPKGTYGRVAPRSGLAVKNFIDVGLLLFLQRRRCY
jgi:dUTP pyrophosphatase